MRRHKLLLTDYNLLWLVRLPDGLMCRGGHVVLTALGLYHWLILLEEVLRHSIDLDIIVLIYRLFILTFLLMLLINGVAIVQALVRGCCSRHEFVLRWRNLLGACLRLEFIKLLICIETVLLLLIMIVFANQVN